MNKMRNIYVYDINNLQLINNKPFKSKLECSKYLNINRGSILKYINTGNIFKYRYIFSHNELDKDDLLKKSIFKDSPNIWEIITGELLGDGHIRLQSRDSARLEFTFSINFVPYINYLKFNKLKSICTDTLPTPWPKNKPNQYWFSSKYMPIFKDIHSKWYKFYPNENKYIKILPDNIEELITPISLAHWMMGDGYYYNNINTIIFCTDNFSKNEVLLLINILSNKFNIKSTIYNRRYKNNKLIEHYRIRISKLDVNKLILLIKPHIIPEMYYKLGIK